MKQKLIVEDQMKRLLLLIIIAIMSIPLTLSAQNVKEVARIKIEPAKLAETCTEWYTEFLLRNKKRVAKYYTLDFKDILKPYFDKIQDSQKPFMMIEAINGNGQRYMFTYNDFDESNNAILPMLIYSDIKSGLGDTVEIWDVKGKKGIVNLEAVDKEFKKTNYRRIYLQMKSLSAAQKKKAFREMAIILPQDQTCKRWLDDIKELVIYIMEPPKQAKPKAAQGQN